MKLRPLGDILLEMEDLLEELTEVQELQKGDILALVSAWIDVHAPDAVEVYEDGTSPVFYYGPGETS